jgi:phenylpropionate dioxygenase-like ring-hydroxylating dioxygenase large terminal subunit
LDKYKKIFFNNWHLIGHDSECINNEDYIKFSTLFGDIVIYNDHGSLICFDNCCPHRGARIFNNDFGSQPFICSYHGWSYNRNQVYPTNPKDFLDCDIKNIKLNTFRLEKCGRFLFFAITPLKSLEDQLGPLFEDLEIISYNINTKKDNNIDIYNCHFGHSIENALEPYHINLVHKDSLGTLNLSAGKNYFYGVNSVWESDVKNERINKLLKTLKGNFDLSNIFEGYKSIYLYPFSMISSTYGLSYSLQNFFPLEINSTKFYSRFYTTNLLSDKFKKSIDDFFQSSINMNRKIFEEDKQICNSINVEWTPEPYKFMSISEVKIKHFKNSIIQDLQLK